MNGSIRRFLRTRVSSDWLLHHKAQTLLSLNLFGIILLAAGTAISRTPLSADHPTVVYTGIVLLVMAEILGVFIFLQHRAAVEMARKEAEQSRETLRALQASEELHRKLVTSIPDLIIRTDLDGTITYTNENVFPFLGYPDAEAILGRKILSFVAPKDKARAAGNNLLLITQTLRPREYLLIGGEPGTYYDTEINGDVLRTNDGTPFGMVFVVRDLSEKKNMQAQLLHSQKMEAIGRLAGGVAHDFNNMLGVILGYGALLEKEVADTPASVRQKVRSIVDAAERSSKMTRQLLAFARRQIIVPAAVDLNVELGPLHKMLARLIGEDTKLQVNQHDDLWTILIDPAQLTQAITNLVTNARDAVGHGGTITIDGKNVVLAHTAALESGLDSGEYVMLSVSDSGMGMDEKTMSQIFEPFFTTKPAGQGTGLGLATVFGIVKQNQGSITVRSTPGRGTIFTIYFPRHHGAAEPPSANYTLSQIEGTETVLVVEDEPALLDLTTYLLESRGYAVKKALSPSKAMAVCDQLDKPLDLLIADVVMPGMNGKELHRLIEAKYPSVRTLFISGYPPDIVARHGVMEEEVNFLQKPFTPNGLLMKVREILDPISRA